MAPVVSPEGGDEGRGTLIEFWGESLNLIPANQQASHLLAGWDLNQLLSGKINNISILRGIMTPCYFLMESTRRSLFLFSFPASGIMNFFSIFLYLQFCLQHRILKQTLTI